MVLLRHISLAEDVFRHILVLSTGLIVFTMFLWPFIDDWLRRTTKISELSVWIGIVGVFLLVGLTVLEAFLEH